LASVRIWRFQPGRPWSVEFGPVASPPYWPGTTHCRRRPGSSRSRSPCPAGQAAPGAASPKPQRPASRAAAASRSCRVRSNAHDQPICLGRRSQKWPAGHLSIHTVVGVSKTPTGQCLCAARTRCLPGRHGRERGADHHWAWVARPATAARSPATARQIPRVQPCVTNHGSTCGFPFC
jgi:hypothetical protein